MTTLLESVSTADEFFDELVELMIEQAQDQAFAMDKARVPAILQGMVALSKKNVTQVDVLISSLLSNLTKKSNQDTKIQSNEDIETVANSAHFVPSSTGANISLALPLNHPTEHIRYHALVLLEKMNDSNAKVKKIGIV